MIGVSCSIASMLLLRIRFRYRKCKYRGTRRLHTSHLSDKGKSHSSGPGIHRVPRSFPPVSATGETEPSILRYHHPSLLQRKRLLPRTAASGCGYMPQYAPVLPLHLAVFGILKNIAHIIRQHCCNFHNLSLIIPICNAMNQAQTVQEKCGLICSCVYSSSAFCSASSFS